MNQSSMTERNRVVSVDRGFTLVELLLALAVGMVVATAVIQALLATTALTSKLTRHLRQQEFAQRTRRLVKSDLARAEISLRLEPFPSGL